MQNVHEANCRGYMVRHQPLGMQNLNENNGQVIFKTKKFPSLIIEENKIHSVDFGKGEVSFKRKSVSNDVPLYEVKDETTS